MEAIYDMAAMELDKTYVNVLPTPCYKLLFIPDDTFSVDLAISISQRYPIENN